MSFAGIVAMLPFFVVFGIGISRLFRGGLPTTPSSWDDPKMIVFVLIVLCAWVGDSFVEPIRVSKVKDDLFAVEGFAPAFVESVRKELEQRVQATG